MDIQRIAKFMEAGGQTVPDSLDLEVPVVEMQQFCERTLDEVEETILALREANPAEVLDGFLDTAYAAFTGAIRFAGVASTEQAWEAIVRANESKIDGTYGPVVQDEETGKILKPEGWKAPDIEGILGL